MRKKNFSFSQFLLGVPRVAGKDARTANAPTCRQTGAEIARSTLSSLGKKGPRPVLGGGGCFVVENSSIAED